MEIGDIALYDRLTVIESTGDCPHPDFVLGDETLDRTTFHWLDGDFERQTEIVEPREVAVVALPDWMTAAEARAWVQSRPDELEPFFDEEWHRHADLLDHHFDGTAWREAKDIPAGE